MYKAFYNLKRNPFEITPDPFFFFPTRRHNEALAALYYGVRRHKGFVVMTGEVGTGKTLLVRCLLQLLNQSDVAYAHVFNSRLSPVEFLQYVAGDFGLNESGKNKSELLLVLSNYVISRHQKKLTTVLVVDEAHHVSTEVLEEIRLLTNLETANEKLLQILLVGQPELDEKLDSIESWQLKQRIALRSQLQSLDLEETRGYIQRRLQLAGANCNSTVLFPADTIVRIHRHSRGIPRLINTVCENALITAYARQTRSVVPDIIEDIAADFRLGVVHQPNRKAERVLADKHFQLILTLERQRSERSRKPFLLMLLDMGDRTPSEKNGKLLEKILAALSGSTRDTDVTGWYRNNSVAGVVFTEFEFDDRDSILSTMITRVSETLRSKLTLEQFNQVNVSFHVFPEDLSPGNPLSSTDPDAPVLAPLKPKPHLRTGSAMAVPEPDDAQELSSDNSFIRVPQLSIENSSTSGPGQ